MSEAIQNTEAEIIITHKLEKFIPVEFAYIDFARSWKKCKCGRIALMRDNWCASCGQKLGMPELKDD